ncbi:GNAT family N-acetyltransferase [Hamadaea tsunoensis]|uniref:GNAT family N-acetyltransferase n=1 Tax=Hamadaea tsunoensis TaxID=53368 RepID=UPI00040FBCE0|nr:GNAT family N-acetyltransferase [Hamadaea tsunoensis]
MSDEKAGRAVDERLEKFLIEWLGGWPGTPGVHVVGADVRLRPGWDGSTTNVLGVSTPDGGVLSVAPALADPVRAAVRTWDDVPVELPRAVGRPQARAFAGTFRYATDPTDLPDAGEWIAFTDERLPAWLRPFGGEALVAFGSDGAYAAGVGIKRHNAYGMEISVGTDERHRGQGLASRLVAQAARHILAAGAVPIYLHDPANTASDRTARRSGFPDLGWKIIGVWG